MLMLTADDVAARVDEGDGGLRRERFSASDVRFWPADDDQAARGALGDKKWICVADDGARPTVRRFSGIDLGRCVETQCVWAVWGW